MSGKRPRTPSNLSSTSSRPPSPSPEPSLKAQRTAPSRLTRGGAHPLLCTLPPTCNPPNRPTPLANSKDLETHYATYHAHVCEEKGCGCVFPEARFLELHQTECHDPIAALRKDRGEKVFACHQSSCTKLFSTPKTRRLHLIQAHGYPKEYFFAVTNKGVGGLLKRWGEGASMIRGSWKARESQNSGEEDTTDEVEDTTDDQNAAEADMDRPVKSIETSLSSRSRDGPLIEEDADEETGVEPDGGVDDLISSMDTLSLVPPAIQFGRGAKRGGLFHHHNPRAVGRGHQSRHPHPHVGSRLNTEVDQRRMEGRGGNGAEAVTDGLRHPNRPPAPPRGLGRGRLSGRGRIAISAGHAAFGGRPCARGRGY